MTVTMEFDEEDLRGLLLIPEDDGFEAACQGFNLTAAHRPAAVVLARSAEDVAAAVRAARRAGLQVQVHATGHGLGVPSDGGVLVNTSLMRSVEIDPIRRTAIVGAGTRWDDVIEAAAEHGLAPLNGSSGTVGVVGYIMGGGMGPMARTFGFAADHVLAIQLVDAVGTILHVDAESEPELFWALRGGKCAVGIVTEIEFSLMDLPDVYAGGLFFAGDDAPAVLHAFREWAPALPESSTTSVALLRLPDAEEVPPPLRGRLSVHLRYLHVGPDDRGAALLAPMRAVREPLVDMVARMPYAAINSVHQDPTDPMEFWDGGLLLSELAVETVDALLATAGPAVDVPLIIAEIRLLGGALAREAQPPNAARGRDAAFLAVAIGPYPPPLRAAVDAAGGAVLDALAPWSAGHQVNFLGRAMAHEEVARAWAPRDLERLRAVTRDWDPEGRFRFGYSAG